MRRKYKIGIIIICSFVFAFLIYIFNKNDKLNIVALGDGIASGETSYNIDGISYNDYLKEYYDKIKLLNNYSSYTLKNLKISELVQNLEDNLFFEEENTYIKQMIHKANIITICIGEEEITKLAITNDLNEDTLKKIIDEYNNLLNILKEITDAKIIVISFYENYYLDKSKIIILNSELANLVEKYKYTFINIGDLMLEESFYLNNKKFYFNYKGHKEIAEMIIHSL